MYGESSGLFFAGIFLFVGLVFCFVCFVFSFKFYLVLKLKLYLDVLKKT